MIRKKRTLVWASAFLALAFSVSFSLKAETKPITAEDVYSSEKIADIIEKKTFFFPEEQVGLQNSWDRWKREHVNHILNSRTEFISQEEILRQGLDKAFSVRLSMEDLYRASMDRHIAIGGVIPKIDFTVGDGATPLTLEKAISGLFGFALPQNWLNISTKYKAYDAAKLLFMQTALDQSVVIKKAYYDALQATQEIEIYNFYFTHLQLLTRYLSKNEIESVVKQPGVEILTGISGTLGTSVGVAMNAVAPAMNTIAQVMVMEKDPTGRYSADKIIIQNPKEIPTRVLEFSELKDISEFATDRNNYVKEAIKRSPEIRMAHILYKVSKQNVALTAFNPSTTSTVGTNKGAHPYEAQFRFVLGYDTIPYVKKAMANKRTSKINLNLAYFNLLDKARRAHGNYNNSIRLYVEAQRSYEFNKKSFYNRLSEMLKAEDPLKFASAMAITLQQIIGAHIAVNQALHDFLRSKVVLERYLLVDEKEFASFLPERKEVRKALKFFEDNFHNVKDFDTHIDHIAQTIKSEKSLDLFLGGVILDEKGEIQNISTEEIKKAILKNSLYLLDGGHKKSKKFYISLGKFISAHEIELSDEDKEILEFYMKHSKIARLFNDPQKKEEEDDSSEFEELRKLAEAEKPKNYVDRFGRYFFNGGHDYHKVLNKKL